MTAWTDHVKMYCAKKGISYKEGLKDKDCKESYHNVKTGNKIFNQNKNSKKSNSYKFKRQHCCNV